MTTPTWQDRIRACFPAKDAEALIRKIEQTSNHREWQEALADYAVELRRKNHGNRDRANQD